MVSETRRLPETVLREELPRVEVVIIGGGIQGLSVAAHLVDAGVTEVTVLESRSMVGTESSAMSARMLMMQCDNDTKMRLAVFSYLKYLRHFDRMNIDPHMDRIGSLSIGGSDLRAQAQTMIEVRRSFGVQTELLASDEIHKFDATIALEDDDVGIFCPDDARIDVGAVIAGLRRFVLGGGARIRTDTSAVGFRVVGSAVTGVLTSRGDVMDCDAVVNAANARAAEIMKMIDLSLHVENARRTVFIVRRPSGFAATGPLVEDAERVCYYRHYPDDGNDHILIGYGKEVSQDSELDSAEGLPWQTVRAAAGHRFPALVTDEPVDRWSGIRSLSPDFLPCVGRVKGIENLVLCCALGGEGVQFAPATGYAVAELISNDLAEVACMDLSALDPNREGILT